MLQRHASAYRFVSDQIVPITSESEIATIETAMEATSTGAIRVASVHLSAAPRHLANRQSPDYRNSIKESISAVEALCKVIAGTTSGVLRQALTNLVQKHQVAMHQQFRTALENLYNFTSDAQGIRHALMDEPTLDEEDARFMLVSCSAFVNYLVIKADKAGISLSDQSS